MSREYDRCGKTYYLSVSKYFFTTLAIWGRALSWRRITLSCLCSYFGRFSRITQLKRINYSWYRSPIWNRQVSAAQSKQDPFGPNRYRAWSSNHKCSAVVNWGWLTGLSVVFFLLGIAVEYPLLSSHNPMQKNLFSVVFESAVRKWKIAFRFQFMRHSISLFLNHSHGSQSYRNGLLNYPQWFCKLLLRLTLIFFE